MSKWRMIVQFRFQRNIDVLISVLLLSLATPVFAQTPPSNDNFADAEVLSGDGTWVGTNVNATVEFGEPDHAFSGGASVWFQWTASADGYLTVDTFGSNYDTTLAMYVGNAVDALTTLAEDDDTGGVQSRLSNVPITAGVTYSIAVDGYLGGMGQITLNWSYWDGVDVTPPTATSSSPFEGSVYVLDAVVLANYTCADQILGSGVASCEGDVSLDSPIDTSFEGAHEFTVVATDIAGNIGNVTVSYSVSGTDSVSPQVIIQSPVDGVSIAQDGLLTANYLCQDEFQGTGIASCVGNVASGASMDTSLAGVYPFTVVGTDNAGNVTEVTVSYNVVNAQPNDNFSNAIPLAQEGSLNGSNVGATKESGEPNHAFNQGGASVWYTWTAVQDGYLTVDTFGSDFNTVLAMYTGGSVDALALLASNINAGSQQSRITGVAVTAGSSYSLAVDGWNGVWGNITLNWSWSDQFDTIPPVVTFWSPSEGLVVAQGGALWAGYSCYDPVPGTGMASCLGNSPNGVLIDTSIPGEFVYTVAGTDNAGNVTEISHTYTVVGNPPNDNFENAIALSSSGTFSGSNAGATYETGEPGHGGIAASTSVWFLYTAPADGFFTANTLGSNFDTVLAAYSGSVVNALVMIASDDDTVGQTSEIKNVVMTAGTTYPIALSGNFDDTGLYTLSWSFVELNDTTSPSIEIVDPDDGALFFEGVSVVAVYSCIDDVLGSGLASCTGDVPSGDALETSVAGSYSFAVTATDNAGNSNSRSRSYSVLAMTNDDFNNALPLAERGDVIAHNIGATKEPGEPDHAGGTGGASVWFSWTASEEGFLSVDTFHSFFDTTLAVYTGNVVTALTEVASSDSDPGGQSEVRDIPVAAGQTYYIAVDGIGGATGQINLDWSLFTGPTFAEITPSDDPLWVTDEEHDFWLNAAAPADIDGDGDIDLVVIGFFVEYNVSATDRLTVMVNDGQDVNGNWLFSSQELPLNGLFAGSSDLAWGDYDNDGDPDLVVGSEGATQIYRNDNGSLVPTNAVLPGYTEDSNYTGAYNLRSLAWADYDNDGDLDLLLPSVYNQANFSYETKLMRNDGDDGAGGWLFTEVVTPIDGTRHAQTAWADKDGDGDLDLFMANVDNFEENGFVRIYQNEGDVFTSSEPVGTLAIEYGLGDWSDYDGDGDLDLLIVGLIRDRDGAYKTLLRIYDNQAGNFVPNTIIHTNFFPWLDLHAATWADYDSDGDVDILVTGAVIGPDNIEGRSEVYVNDGNEFTPLGRALPAPVSSSGRGGSFTWFDVDNDGDLDYFVAGAYYVPNGNGLIEAQMHLYLNEATTINARPQLFPTVQAVVQGEDVTFNWDAAVDDSTQAQSISYQLDVIAQGPGQGVAQSRLPEPGKINGTTSWTLRGLAPGTYTWSLRAVDTAFNGSVPAQGTFTIGGTVDSDSDGVVDSADNCTQVANPNQNDSDSDGYGNYCDPDFDNNGVVNFLDVSYFSNVVFTTDPHADLNGDGAVNFLDYSILVGRIFMPPGPSWID